MTNFIAAGPRRYAVVRCPFVCLPICPSGTFLYCIETSKHILNLFHNQSSISVPKCMAIFRLDVVASNAGWVWNI